MYVFLWQNGKNINLENFIYILPQKTYKIHSWYPHKYSSDSLPDSQNTTYVFLHMTIQGGLELGLGQLQLQLLQIPQIKYRRVKSLVLCSGFCLGFSSANMGSVKNICTFNMDVFLFFFRYFSHGFFLDTSSIFCFWLEVSFSLQLRITPKVMMWSGCYCGFCFCRWCT